jgi:hypothetical protein
MSRYKTSKLRTPKIEFQNKFEISNKCKKYHCIKYSKDVALKIRIFLIENLFRVLGFRAPKLVTLHQSQNQPTFEQRFIFRLQKLEKPLNSPVDYQWINKGCQLHWKLFY